MKSPPCLQISNRKYPPCPQNSIIVNPPSPSEIQKAVRGIGMDIFWNRPIQKWHGEIFFILSPFDKYDKMQLLATFEKICALGS